jgi:hypothetical protein
MMHLTESASLEKEVRSTRAHANSPAHCRARTVIILFLTACLFGSWPNRSFAQPFSSDEAQTSALLSQMTLDEKIGQMTQADSKVPASK